MAWSCKCGITLPFVPVYPVRCHCGLTHREDGVEGEFHIFDDNPFPCIYRMGSVGSLACGCEGDLTVYECKLHQMCALRKLKPGSIQEVQLKDDSVISTSLAFCNTCKEITPPETEHI